MTEQIRRLAAGEVDRYGAMIAQAFQIDATHMASWRASTQPDTLRGLFVDGQMRAALTLFDFQVWFGAATVPAGGLAGVATPPEHRRQGYIDRLLAAAVDEMRAAGQPLSVLYPFYFPFYKRYGWAHVSDDLEYTIPIERLPSAPPSGTWHPAMVATDAPQQGAPPPVADADLAVLMEIYDAWAPGHVGLLARDAHWWRSTRLGGPRNIFYWRDPRGRARAYVSYGFKSTGDWERELQVRESVALDAEAYRMALSFLRNHDSQARTVSIRQPGDSRLLALLDDPRVKVSLDPGFMLRMVDVAAALEARRYPPGAGGRLVLAVAEGFRERTPHRYTLEVRDGAGHATSGTEAPDLSLDQGVLSQLYAGYMTASQAAAWGFLQVHEPAALARADAFFAGPRPYMADFF